jgi:hypothetical protein
MAVSLAVVAYLGFWRLRYPGSTMLETVKLLCLHSFWLLDLAVGTMLRYPFWLGLLWARGILFAFLGFGEVAVALDLGVLWWPAMLGPVLLVSLRALVMMRTPELRQAFLARMDWRTKLLRGGSLISLATWMQWLAC